MNGAANNIIRCLHIARIVLFLIGVTIPLLGFCLPWQTGSRLNSKGEPAEVPKLGTDPCHWGQFVLASRDYFNEQFGFRDQLIRLHAVINVRWFGVAANDKVVPGKEGWLYLGKYHDAIEYSRNVRPFTDDELEVWKNILEKRRDHLRERGIEYVFVIVPNKETIYPEFLPDWYNRVHPRSRLDQLMAHLHEHSDVKIVDLRPALFAAKGELPLYYKTDSHWNALGASVGYRTLIQAIGEWFPVTLPPAITDFTVKRITDGFHGDLLDLSGLGDLTREDDVVVIPRIPRQAKCELLGHIDGEEERRESEPSLVTECDSINLPRAVIFRDSFFSELQPFVSEHFRRAVFLWQPNFDGKIVEREPCEIVIQEMAERSLIWWPQSDVFSED